MSKHLNIKIHGRVQGVFYRDTAKSVATKLGIKGWVRNEPDGTVYIEIEGQEGELKRFVQWCQQGPSTAAVNKVEVEQGEIEGFTGFEVKF